MPLSHILAVVFRLGLVLFLIGKLDLISALVRAARHNPANVGTLMLWLGLGVLLLVSLVVFRHADWIARLFTWRLDGEVNLAGVTSRDMHCVAITCVGLYFMLSTVDDLVIWACLVAAGMEMDSEPTIAPVLATFTAGALCLVFAALLPRREVVVAVSGKD